MEFMGLSAQQLDNPPGAPVDVWPEHQQPLQIFAAVRTQWRMGARCPIGLDYNVLDDRLARRLGLTPAQLDQSFADIQTMERHALELFAEQLAEAKR